MAAGMPFASVVVPSRARPRLLLRALEGLRRQADRGWEAVVVDDGDGEGIEAAAGLGDPRVRALRNPGRGQVEARSAGLALARGRVVCFLDDDDWWDDPGHLGLVRAALRDGPAVLFRGGWLVGDGGSREAFDWDATPESLRENNTVLTSSIAYPREAHATIGPLDASLGGYWDWDLLLRLAAAGLPLRRLPGLGVCYAVHGGGSSADRAAPERAASFERLRAKHGLRAEIHNHATLHAALRDS